VDERAALVWGDEKGWNGIVVGYVVAGYMYMSIM
jgi:hypothetical protein